MGIYRIYADTTRRSRCEEIDLANPPDWVAGVEVTTARFTVHPAGMFLDWHPAPRRQFVFIISGHLEIGFEDGSTKTFGPGDIRLVEDTTGRGHTTAVVGDQTCITATAVLKSQTGNSVADIDL